MPFKFHAIFLTFPLLFFVTTGEIVKNFQICSTTSNCEISQLRITPCPEAKLPKPKPCIMTKGKNATIEFDFVAKPGLSSLTAGAYSSVLFDIPLEGMDTVGCDFTPCPTTGTSQTYSYNLLMKDYFPAAPYKVKWRLSKDADMECCLTFRIKLESQ